MKVKQKIKNLYTFNDIDIDEYSGFNNESKVTINLIFIRVASILKKC